MDNAYVRSPREVLEHFNVNEDAGLSDMAAAAAQQKYGKNGTLRNRPSHATRYTDT
jgi:P-type Ca2+ transporter type 2A